MLGKIAARSPPAQNFESIPHKLMEGLIELAKLNCEVDDALCGVYQPLTSSLSITLIAKQLLMGDCTNLRMNSTQFLLFVVIVFLDGTQILKISVILLTSY